MINIYVLILLCALVTFIPRLIPAIAVDKLNFGPKFEKFLKKLKQLFFLDALFCTLLKLSRYCSSSSVLLNNPVIWLIIIYSEIVWILNKIDFKIKSSSEKTSISKP